MEDLDFDFDLPDLDSILQQIDKQNNGEIDSAGGTVKCEISEEVEELLEGIESNYRVIAKLPQDVLSEEELGLLADFEKELSKYKRDLMKFLSEFAYEQKSLTKTQAVLHAFKGSVNTIGLKRCGKELHNLETFIANVLNKTDSQKKLITYIFQKRIEHLFYSIESVFLEKSSNFLPVLFTEEELKGSMTSTVGVIKQEQHSIMEESIFVPLSQINTLVENANGMKMRNRNLQSEVFQLRQLMDDYAEIMNHLQRSVRELEEYADESISTSVRSASVQKDDEELDPLLLDRFTVINEISRSITEVFYDLEDYGKRLKVKQRNFNSNFEEMNLLTSNSLERLLKLRLIDFSNLETRFQTACRKAGENFGKKVKLEVYDNGVQIDATLTDQLKGAIELIIRNSVGHGIENEELRIQRKKSPIGKIVIDAQQSANALLLTIKDDGGGVDVEKVRKKAIEKGLISPETPFGMKEAIAQILKSGFSTADKLSDNAGRGVGLDSVHEEVVKLGGSFHINSEEGKGMEVSITIPTTYATTYGLLVRIGKERITILNDSVLEVSFLTKEQYKESEKTNTFNYLDKVIPLVAGADLFGVVREKDPNQQFQKILILNEGDELLALQVDEIIENREILIKHIDVSMKSIPGLLGVSLLLDGYPSYVLEPIKTYRHRKKNAQDLSSKLEVQTLFVPNVLVVDDSPVIRTHTKKFLDKHGFKNFSAKNGKDALEKMLKSIPDLILLDIEMPEMNGFELTEHLKQDALYKDIPIIMITSRINNIHKQKAKELGVNQYLIKPFVHEELLALIQELGYKK